MPVGGGTVTPVLGGGSFGDLAVLPDGRTLVGTQASLTHPAEIVRFGADGRGLARVTRVNDAFLAPFGLRPGGERLLRRGRRARASRPGS